MKRLTLWLAIFFTTLILGAVVTIICLVRRTPTDISPVTIHEGSAAPAECSSFPGLSVKVESTTSSSFFPSRVFKPQPEHEKIFVEWYSKHLSAMGETPLLSRPDSQGEDYRFLWLRSFHRPVAVHIWRSGDEQSLNVKELDGAGGYEPGKLITNQTQSLAKGDWEGFIRLLDQTCFWNLPPRNDEMGNDGAQWILEGRRAERYHVVDRWTPNHGTFREACLYLLKLSRLEIDDEEVY